MAWAVVQSAKGQANGATTVTATLPNTPTVGNKIIVMWTECSTTGAFSTIQDGNGNALTQLKTVSTALNNGIIAAIHSYDVPTTQSQVFTATFTLNRAASLIVMEVTGLRQGTGVAILDGLGGSGVAATPTLPAVVYNSSLKNLMVLHAYCDNGELVTFAVANGYTLLPDNYNTDSVSGAAFAYKNSVAASEPQGFSISSGNAAGEAACMKIGFKINPELPSINRKPIRLRAMRVRKGTITQPFAVQAVVPNPAITFNVKQPRELHGLARQQRGKLYNVVPPQLNPPFPFSEIKQPRIPRGLQPRQGKKAEVIPPQLNPPFPFAPIKQPIRLRGLRVRRAKPIETVPAQQAATPNPLIVFVLKPIRTIRQLQRRGHGTTNIPAQSYPITENVQPRRLRGLQVRRSKPVEVIPTQVVVTNPVIVFVLKPIRTIRQLQRRGHGTTYIRDQSYPVTADTQPRRLRGLPTRRAKPIEVVPSQIVIANPLIVWTISQPRRLRGLLRRKGRIAEPVWPQQAIASNPAITWVIRYPRVVRGLLQRQVKKAEVIPPQFNPAIVFTTPQKRRIIPAIRRSKSRDQIPDQAVPNYRLVSRRAQPQVSRRRRSDFPWFQAVPPVNPAFVRPLIRPARVLRGWWQRGRRFINFIPTKPPLGPFNGHAIGVMSFPTSASVVASTPTSAAVTMQRIGTAAVTLQQVGTASVTMTQVGSATVTMTQP